MIKVTDWYLFEGVLYKQYMQDRTEQDYNKGYGEWLSKLGITNAIDISYSHFVYEVPNRVWVKFKSKNDELIFRLKYGEYI